MFQLSKTTLAVACVVGLSACASAPGVVEMQKKLEKQSAPAMATLPDQPIPLSASTVGSSGSMQARIAEKAPVVRAAAHPWIGGTKMVHVQDDTLLPPIFNKTFSFTFDDKITGGRVPLAVVAERLARMTGVIVRIKNDVTSAQGSGGAAPSRIIQPQRMPTPFPVRAGSPLPSGDSPSGALPSAPFGADQAAPYDEPLTSLNSVEAKWDGSLRGYLDHVTSRLGLSWAFRDGQVIIERFVTESFEITTLAGTQSFTLSLNGGNSGSSGEGGVSGTSSSSMDVSEEGKTAILDSMKKAIELMVANSGGSVVLNEGTGRFFVTAPKDVMGRVRDLIKGEDAALQRQAHIQFDVYSVVSNEGDQRGLDWNLLISNMAKTWGATIKSPASMVGADAATMGLSILETAGGNLGRLAGSTPVLQMLNEVGSSALYRPISVIAMNHQWGRKTNIKTDGYVSETTPSTSSSAGSGAPGLKTSSVATGDKVMVKPAIMNNGDIVLKFGLSFSELLSLFDVTAGSGDSLQRVQTPVTSGTDDQGTVLLKPGQAMVITGLSRRLSTSDVRSLSSGVSPLMGGSLKDKAKVENFVVVVRAMKI